MATIFFVSIISRENRPVHVQQIDPSKGKETVLADKVTGTQTEPPHAEVDDLLKFQFLSNMSLDIFQSPVYEGEAGQPSLLFIHDGINVYGYETNTGLKILIGTDTEIDNSFDTIFKGVHRAYLGLVINPFQDPENINVNPTTFGQKIHKVVSQWRSK